MDEAVSLLAARAARGGKGKPKAKAKAKSEPKGKAKAKGEPKTPQRAAAANGSTRTTKSRKRPAVSDE